jgi:hypothetical protein
MIEAKFTDRKIINLSPRLRVALRQRAEKDRVSESEVVRRALALYLNEEVTNGD